MAAEYFNSLGGFSVGIPSVAVVDSNGNIISNFNNLSGNVSANRVYANTYFYANGQPFTANAAGNNFQLQYNNNGAFAGIPNVTWNGNSLNLGNVAALRIGGGLNGYFLQTDGAGNLSWSAGGGGGGNGSPGGANTQIQFNDASTFGGDSGFTYNKDTDTLSVINVNAIGEVSLGSVSNLTITGGTAGYYLRTDGTGNLTWDLPGGGGNGTPGGANTQVQFNDEGEFDGISTFTFDKNTGILTIPIISATTVSASGFQTTGNLTAGNIKANTLANIAGNLRVSGNVNFTSAANVSLGPVANLKISGGTNGYVLTTDGLGNLDWLAAGGGGNGTPGGSNTQVQFNNNGLFGASPFFTFNNSTSTVQVAGNLIGNTFQMGAGVYKFSTSEVYFATTASTAPNQVLYSIPTDDISGVEFHIIATDSTGGSRQSSKISSVVYNGQVQFNEYAGLYINGGVGTLQVDYYAGNIIHPPSLELKVTPDSSNQTVYKMLITVFSA
jgi:hypothetical protein